MLSECHAMTASEGCPNRPGRVRQVEVGRQRHKGVDVVGLAVELQQLAAPVLAALRGDVLQQLEQSGA